MLKPAEHKNNNNLEFAEYRFRKSEAALIHAHLVFLAYILRYRITKVVQESPGSERKLNRDLYITRNINAFANNYGW